MVGIEGAQDQVTDLITDLIELVAVVLLEDVFFEIIWNKLFVFIFVSLSSTWVFLLGMCVFLWIFNKKYIENVR